MLHYYHIPIFKCHVGTNQNLIYLLPHQQRARVKAKWFQPRVHRQWVIMSHYQVLVKICLPTPRRSHIRPIRLLLIQRARVKVKAKRIWIPPLILRRPLVNLFLPTPRPDHLRPIRLFLIQRARVKVKVNPLSNPKGKSKGKGKPPLITRPYLRPMIKGQRQSKKYNFRCRCQKEDEKKLGVQIERERFTVVSSFDTFLITPRFTPLWKYGLIKFIDGKRMVEASIVSILVSLGSKAPSLGSTADLFRVVQIYVDPSNWRASWELK